MHVEVRAWEADVKGRSVFRCAIRGAAALLGLEVLISLIVPLVGFSPASPRLFPVVLYQMDYTNSLELTNKATAPSSFPEKERDLSFNGPGAPAMAMKRHTSPELTLTSRNPNTRGDPD